MNSSMIAWFESIFNLVYMIAVWVLVIAMYRRRTYVARQDQVVARYFFPAFVLLALGDSAHVGFRILAFLKGDLNISARLLGAEYHLVGLGVWATSLTLTFFYALILEAWRSRFNRTYRGLPYLLLAAAVVRFLILLHPANGWRTWTSLSSTAQPWSAYRNIPMLIQGLGVAYLILRDALPQRDKLFSWIGGLILISYACYTPVILWVDRYPLVGMLMLPKTLAYLGIVWNVYHNIYQPRHAQA